MSYSVITPEDLALCLENGKKIHLIDVRTQGEHKAEHVVGAECMPLQELNPETVLAKCGKGEEPLYLLCQSGQRARMAAEKFKEVGHRDVVVVEGGTAACINAGLPIVRGQGVMSLERQVRIAAGSLVVTGVLLALLFHPAFIGLSAFVGAGLVFAGLTDTCAMGMLIARMPWNK